MRYHSSAFDKIYNTFHYQSVDSCLQSSSISTPNVLGTGSGKLSWRMIYIFCSLPVVVAKMTLTPDRRQLKQKFKKILRHMFLYKCVQGSSSCFCTKQSCGWPLIPVTSETTWWIWLLRDFWTYETTCFIFVLFKKSLIYTKFKNVTSF